MALTARLVLPGVPHHVVQRGVRSMDIFESDADRTVYLQLLARLGHRHGVSFLAWCLMTNHVHLIAIPIRLDSLARGIGNAHRRYSQLVNQRTGASGHLFQARFYSYPIQADSHLLASARYVELNPVFAGLASCPEDYPWSSARYHLSGCADPLVTSDPLAELAPDWRAFLSDGVRLAADRERIERHLTSGYPLGDDKWAHAVGENAGFHYPPKRPGRPASRS